MPRLIKVQQRPVHNKSPFLYIPRPQILTYSILHREAPPE